MLMHVCTCMCTQHACVEHVPCILTDDQMEIMKVTTAELLQQPIQDDH
jgi:hypothetical protein